MKNTFKQTGKLLLLGVFAVISLSICFATYSVLSINMPPTTKNLTTDKQNGATARCSDGFYTYTRTHIGACSHHGGVEEYYK